MAAAPVNGTPRTSDGWMDSRLVDHLDGAHEITLTSLLRSAKHCVLLQPWEGAGGLNSATTPRTRHRRPSPPPSRRSQAKARPVGGAGGTPPQPYLLRTYATQICHPAQHHLRSQASHPGLPPSCFGNRRAGGTAVRQSSFLEQPVKSVVGKLVHWPLRLLCMYHDTPHAGCTGWEERGGWWMADKHRGHAPPLAGSILRPRDPLPPAKTEHR